MGLMVSISSIFSRLFGKKPMKILMLGLYGAGKTTILYKIKLDQVIETIPTIGMNLEVVEHKNISFNVWDIPGHTKVWRLYFADTDGIIFVVDSNDRTEIIEAEQQLHNLLNNEMLTNPVLLVIANKQDLPDVMSTTELTDKLKLNNIKNRKWCIQAASAITGEGLFEGLDWLSNELSSR